MFPHLHLQIRKQLLEEITVGIYAEATILPSENKLCERLGVSRSTIRHSVTSLEQEGYLRRRQGIGTEIDRNVCSMKGRIDLNDEFSEFLSQLGYKPERKYIDSKLGVADKYLADALKIAQGDPVISITKIWLVNGKPAIWCTDTFSTSLFHKPYRSEDLENDIFSFLQSFCKQEIYYQIATIEVKRLGAEIAPFIQLPADEPVIYSFSIACNPNGIPILASKEVYVPEFVSFTVLRKKI